MTVQIPAFSFNARKAVEAASRFLELAGGQIEVVRLMKLLYLAERRALELYLHPIFGDHYVSMPHGPVVSQVYDLAKPIPQGRNGEVVLWGRHLRPHGIFVTLIESARPAALSRADLSVIEQVHSEWETVDTWSLVAKLHNTLPEWVDPKGSSQPIELLTLCRALKLSESEIENVRELSSLSARLVPVE